MTPGSGPKPARRGAADRVIDAAVTLACWAYFTLGFIVFFSPLYLGAALLGGRRRQTAFQRLNRFFYQGFFLVVRTLCPRQRWTIDPDIAALRSSVILCNHLSYLDPLLLIALLDRSTTIVKTTFFRLPLFGTVIRAAGYLPATGEEPYARLLLTRMEALPAYLASGGNLFVFPEGTRSRDSAPGPLNRGALKIARLCQAPLCIIRLAGTDHLFPPGRFFFTTRGDNTISAAIVDRIAPSPTTAQMPLADLEDRIRRAFDAANYGHRPMPPGAAAASSTLDPGTLP